MSALITEQRTRESNPSKGNHIEASRSKRAHRHQDEDYEQSLEYTDTLPESMKLEGLAEKIVIS
jgi:hypothetical protein